MYLQIKAHQATSEVETCECFKQISSQIKKTSDQMKYLETMLFVDAYKFKNKSNKSAILARPKLYDFPLIIRMRDCSECHI